jgi:hypothetical protein
MQADLIIYILLCLVIASFVKRLSRLAVDLNAQAIEIQGATNSRLTR